MAPVWTPGLVPGQNTPTAIYPKATLNPVAKEAVSHPSATALQWITRSPGALVYGEMEGIPEPAFGIMQACPQWGRSMCRLAGAGTPSQHLAFN